MLPTPTINSNSEEKFPKMASIRTFSPSVEKISFKLNEKRREKTNKRKQEAIIDRLENVLEEYQNELTTCKAEKEILRKENKKLKEQLLHSKTYQNH